MLDKIERQTKAVILQKLITRAGNFISDAAEAESG